MELTLYQVDAFTSRLFHGNPAAVCPLESWLPEEQMQAIALENNLSETAFFISRGSDFELRWFTPAIEVALCGHATLATAHVLFQHLGYEAEEIRLHTRSGLLKVAKEGDFYLLDFPADTLQPITPPQELLEALGVIPLETFAGREDYLVILDSRETLAQLMPDFRQLTRLNGRGVIASAPGVEVDFVSRCFFPNAGIDEDPVTGSAHTTMIPYWSKKLGKDSLTARQISPRGGTLRCRMRKDRVEIGGQAVTYLIGKIFL